jgi:hypothetical protein
MQRNVQYQVSQVTTRMDGQGHLKRLAEVEQITMKDAHIQ